VTVQRLQLENQALKADRAIEQMRVRNEALEARVAMFEAQTGRIEALRGPPNRPEIPGQPGYPSRPSPGGFFHSHQPDEE
jgi:hypothetical protein